MVQQFIFFVRAFFDFLIGTLLFAKHRVTQRPLIAVFGSARTPETHPYYELGRNMGRKLAEAGFGVLTGGGPGMMEAANRGAFEQGGLSIACNIQLPHEQKPNPYLTFAYTCRYFFTRKYFLMGLPQAFIILPGGYGTFDELFELLTLTQTKTLERKKIFIVGKEFWCDLIQWIETKPLKERMIDQSCLELFEVSDDLDQIVTQLKK